MFSHTGIATGPKNAMLGGQDIPAISIFLRLAVHAPPELFPLIQTFRDRRYSPLGDIHLTGVSDLPPRAVQRRSLQAGRMSAFSLPLGRSLWAPSHDKVVVAHQLVVGDKLQSSVEEHPAVM